MYKSMFAVAVILAFAISVLAQDEAPKGKVKANTQFSAKITRSIDAESSSVGEDINFVLTNDLQGDGMTIPSGSEMYARIVNVQKLSDDNKRSKISIMFDFVQSGEDFMNCKAVIVGIDQMADVKMESSETFEGGTILTLTGRNLKIDEGKVFQVKLIKDISSN